MTPATYLLFTNECVGLGHLRRALSIAVAITERDDDATVLIVTGAPIELAHPLPPRVDTVKLPMIARDSSGEQRAGRLAIGLPDVRALRLQLALATAKSFGPAVALVDKAPLGLGDELAPALEWLHHSGAKIVLGLRDIEDAPARVRGEWERPLVRATFEHLYDAVVVYGPEGNEEHALACLDWETTMPVHHVGYVASPPTETAPGHDDEYVLATAGGGADGAAMLSTFLDALRLEPLPVSSLLVTGPLMPEDDVRALHARAEGLDVTVETFRPGLDAAIASARGVVSMAGYNTVSELLRTGRPALLVPRTHPSREQCVRAEHLREAGRADVLHPDELDPRSMRAALARLLATAPHEPHEDHTGAARTAEVLDEITLERAVLEAAS